MNLLEITTDGFVFLQLLIQEVKPLLAIKTVITVDIPKYSSYNDLYRFSKEMILYVKTHQLQKSNLLFFGNNTDVYHASR